MRLSLLDIAFLSQSSAPAPVFVWSVDVTVSSADVTSTLVNFPLLIHFETLGDGFWDNVTATGGDIRAFVGETQIPFHLTAIDASTRKGWGFALVPSLSSVSDTTVTLAGDGNSPLPAADSTYGSEAVWADYEAVYMLNGSLDDSTGNGHTLVETAGTAQFDLVEWGAGGGIVSNGNTILTSSGFPVPHTTFTFGVTGNSHRNDPPSNGGIIGFYGTYGTDIDRVALVHRNLVPNRISIWDQTNSFLDEAGIIYSFEPHRFNVVFNGTASRRVYRDGVQIIEDLSVDTSNQDGSNFVLADSGQTSEWYGEVGWAYVRLSVLSADWLAVETAMIQPGFITVSDLPAVVPFTEVYNTPTSPVSSLTDFPYLIKLTSLSPDFWHNVRNDGGDIRVYNGSDVQIPFHLISIDRETRVGFLFAKQTIGTSGATFKLEVGYPSRTALGPTDTYGSEAVWSDYEAVYMLNSDQLDSTANSRDLTVKTGSPVYRTLLGLPALDTNAAAFQSSVDNTITPSAIYTMACTASMDVDDSNNEQCMTFCQTYGTTTNRSTLGHHNTGDFWTTYSASNSWLDSTIVRTTGVPVRLAGRYDGATVRHFFVNGNLEATDSVITSLAMDTLTVGGGSSSSPGANILGRLSFVYLRLALLSDDWLAYEADMLLTTPNVVESIWVGGEA